ncbi:hypothetical protein [Nocardia sp. NPDC057440]
MTQIPAPPRATAAAMSQPAGQYDDRACTAHRRPSIDPATDMM